jgi:hypothetical protein
MTRTFEPIDAQTVHSELLRRLSVSDRRAFVNDVGSFGRGRGKEDVSVSGEKDAMRAEALKGEEGRERCTLTLEVFDERAS